MKRGGMVGIDLRAIRAADETVDSAVRAHIRRIFAKYKAQGLPNKKIAAILDVSENTMKKAMKKAL